MTYAIAAAGTGGHVFPGLAVGEALVVSGVPQAEILFVGGSRLESQIFPEAGFPFFAVEIAGLQRRLTAANLRLPAVVLAAARRLTGELRSREVAVMLGMGGYVSVPAGLAARRSRAVLMLHEQNAEAGVANRVMSRWARRTFGSFPKTARLPLAQWVGNPVRRAIASFNRPGLKGLAQERYGLDPERSVVGIFGGSLGAGILNRAAESLAAVSDQGHFSLLHLTGSDHLDAVAQSAARFPSWRTVGFEDRMEVFYAACDLVVARAGGAVAELTATATPIILVPGRFGSADHQAANASALVAAGAAVVVDESDLGRLPAIVTGLLADQGRLQAMAAATSKLARPEAADVVAAAMREAHG